MRGRERREALEALLRAAVSEPETARAAWARWSAGRSLDDVSWEELRLLGAVAARAERLGVDPARRPRLDGIRRFVWTQTQRRLAAAAPLLQRLGAQEIPACLLKGAALIAGGHLAPGERFLRDVDVLVPRARLADAVATLLGAGWSAARYGSAEEIFSLGFPRCHALAFRGPGDGEIDLHLSAVELNRFPRSDDALWSRAAPARLFGVTVHVPAPADLLCTGLVHSYLSDRAQGTDWAVDAAALARSPELDWGAVMAEAQQRGVDALLRARLSALRARRALAPPAAVLAWLDGPEPEPELRRELECLERRRGWRPGAQRRVHRAARALRARRLLAAGAGAASDEKPPLPPARGWLRLDTPLPEGFPATGAPRALELTASIERARSRLPIRYQLYCGSVRLATGRTRPGAWLGAGGVHALRVAARLDPAVAAAEGRPPLSLYFGRRSRAASALGPEAVVRIRCVR